MFVAKKQGVINHDILLVRTIAKPERRSSTFDEAPAGGRTQDGFQNTLGYTNLISRRIARTLAPTNETKQFPGWGPKALPRPTSDTSLGSLVLLSSLPAIFRQRPWAAFEG